LSIKSNIDSEGADNDLLVKKNKKKLELELERLKKN